MKHFNRPSLLLSTSLLTLKPHLMIHPSYLLVNPGIVVADKASLQEVQLVCGFILLLLLP
jgi:hypothetical protein